MPSIRITKGNNLSMIYRKRKQSMEEELANALHETMKDVKHAAEAFTGAKAYRMNRPKQRASAPYARRKPHPPLPPFLVNSQSGKMERSWRTVVNRQGKTLSGTLYNTAPYSHFFNGRPTRHMIGRPILQEVARVQGPKYRKKAQAAVRRAMSKR